MRPVFSASPYRGWGSAVLLSEVSCKVFRMCDPSIANTTLLPPAVTSQAVIGRLGVYTALSSPEHINIKYFTLFTYT